jgi:hypothetical protein
VELHVVVGAGEVPADLPHFVAPVGEVVDEIIEVEGFFEGPP